MNRRQFIPVGVAGLAAWALADAPKPETKPPTALLFRQPLPDASRFFWVQFKRDAAPQGIFGSLFDLAPDYVKPRLDVMGMATTCEVEPANAGFVVLRMKDARMYQFKGKTMDLMELQSIRMGESPISVSYKAVNRKITYHKNSCQTWITGGDTTDEVSLFLLADQPIRWSWALLLVENNRINLYIAEKLKVVNDAKGTLQFSGSVITFGFEGLHLVDLAEADLPETTMILDFNKQHDFVAMKSCDRAEMVAELKNPTP